MNCTPNASKSNFSTGRRRMSVLPIASSRETSSLQLNETQSHIAVNIGRLKWLQDFHLFPDFVHDIGVFAAMDEMKFLARTDLPRYVKFLHALMNVCKITDCYLISQTLPPGWVDFLAHRSTFLTHARVLFLVNVARYLRIKGKVANDRLELALSRLDIFANAYPVDMPLDEAFAITDVSFVPPRIREDDAV